MPGPVLAAPYHATGDPAHIQHTYARSQNPTWSHFEAALSELEGGPAVVFASGMAAVMAVFGVTLRPGDVLVLPTDSYFAGRALAHGYLTEMGIQVRSAPTADNAQAALLDGAHLLWIESPCNPRLDVCDIRALAEAAHERGALVAVDNTTATLLAQQPLALGADFSVAADTKALTGHSDLLMGHVAVRDAAWHERLRTWRTQTGAIPGPFEVWLAHRSLATLEVRLNRQTDSAQKIAEFLSQHPTVRNVRYPGLPADPSHPVAARQMQRFGTLVSFELPDRAAAERFLSACSLIYEATSFGGIHSSAERRARWGGDDVSEGFVRLSVGIENVEDLIEDLGSALAR